MDGSISVCRRPDTQPTPLHPAQAQLVATGFANKRRCGGVAEMGKVTGFEDRVETALWAYDCEKYDPEPTAA